MSDTTCMHMMGGLGNQMFIAAAGLAMADRNGSSLAFNLESYTWDPKRDYMLGAFDLAADLLPDGVDQAFRRKVRQSSRLAGKKPAKGKLFTRWTQAGFHYDPSFEALEGNLILRGYFQSPHFFLNASEEIRKAFSLEPLLTNRGRQLTSAARSAGENSVAVHVRRGDYITDPATVAVHGQMGETYYRKALRLIERGLDAPHLFIVSDEPEAAEEMFRDYPLKTVATGTKEFDDMHLIGCCHHRIIANSSFSWWGAWLGAQRPNGLTIAPRQWMTRDVMRKMSTIDLFPDEWILV